MTDINELPADDLAQRSFILDVLAAVAVPAAGEVIKDGIKLAADKLNPPPGKHAAGHEQPPAGDAQDGG